MLKYSMCRYAWCRYACVLAFMTGSVLLAPHTGNAQADPLQSQTPSAVPATTVNTLYVFDLEAYLAERPLNKVWQYDVVNLVSALQGLVNRERPQLYVLYVREQLSGHQMNVDEFYLKQIRGYRKPFSNFQIVELKTLEDVITTFQRDIPYFSGVVTWDPNVPATGNLALSISGANGLIPVRHDTSPNSLMSQIVTSGLALPVIERLHEKFSALGSIPETDGILSTGNSKTDAYIWGRHNLIEQGESSNEYMAAMLDPFDWDPSAPGFQYPNLQWCMIANHDFYVAKKAFFFDLDPWWNEVSTDIPEDPFLLGLDKEVLDPLLKAVYDRANPGNKIIKIGGFLPWWVKYTTEAGGSHDSASTVEEFVSIISGYSGILDADNFRFIEMANASVFQHYPLKNRYFQNPIPPKVPLENKNYVLFVIGDFRSSALMYQVMPSLWQDPVRGSIPITWAFNPIVSERIPHIIDWMYETRTANDYFAAGSTGAGLCFPNRFVPPRNSSLDNDLEDWIKTSKAFYQKFDLHTTIAADLDRESNDQMVFFQPWLQDAFLEFSPHGVVTVKQPSSPFGAQFVPFFHQSSQAQAFRDPLPDIPVLIEEMLKSAINPVLANRPQFHVYRFNVMSPTSIRIVWDQLRKNYPEYNWQALDPYTFFYLLRQHNRPYDAQPNTLIPTFIEENLPLEANVGQQFLATVRIRNNGWDVWNPPGTTENMRYRLSYHWQLIGEEDIELGNWAAFDLNNVVPGQTVDVDNLFQAPETPGIYHLILFIEQENVKQSVIKYRAQITVQ